MATAIVAVMACAAVSADERCAPHVEPQPSWHTARLRAHTDAFRVCTVAEKTYREIVGAWLADPASASAGLTSFALGRAVDYPWISTYLARRARDSEHWDPSRARNASGALNRYVASLLGEPDFLQRLDAPFAGSAYAVTGVSVEKVLVQPASEVLGESARGDMRVPFDAQIWLVLEPRTAGSG